ncbi:YHS domain protein [Endozoicomonas sp. G2_1]|uniref:YHS domain-containing (seleno)protein n=1 Tax=Endozoicomonas sp. G2_1 TaxID=2821091 RepID=UPI001ADB198D|nr:YHS domain-containing (seleno)protein [Endozoicomonas sp. G2_1]MBO9491464.1 YHS domain protein [Endozoicomonas sp. G2_1]
MNIKKMFLSLAAMLAFTATANAGEYQNSTPAVQGYDVVSYHTGKRPIKGNGNFVATHKGATYIFANKANQEKFSANPEKYVPAYGGYCAFGVSVGKKFIGDPEVFRLVDGKVYLNLDAGIQDMWLKDVPGKINQADKNWKKIKNKSPASL